MQLKLPLELNLLAKERNSLTPTEVDKVKDKTEGHSGQTWPTCARRLRWVPSELRSLDFDAIDTMEANQVAAF